MYRIHLNNFVFVNIIADETIFTIGGENLFSFIFAADFLSFLIMHLYLILQIHPLTLIKS